MNYYKISDIGLVREKNQDSMTIVHNKKGDVLALVCDGIGGNKAGEVASFEIVKYFNELFTNNEGFKDSEDVITYFKYHVRLASNKVYKLSLLNSDYEGMGTTITGIVHTDFGTYTINAGDSRVYGYHDHQLIQLTKDNTYVNELLERKMITPEEALTHPKRHYLTRFLGVFEDATSTIYRVSDMNRCFLICSDGLHSYVKYDEIFKIMDNDNYTAEVKAKELMKKAIKAGGYDNITVIVLDLDEEKL